MYAGRFMGVVYVKISFGGKTFFSLKTTKSFFVINYFVNYVFTHVT